MYVSLVTSFVFCVCVLWFMYKGLLKNASHAPVSYVNLFSELNKKYFFRLNYPWDLVLQEYNISAINYKPLCNNVRCAGQKHLTFADTCFFFTLSTELNCTSCVYYKKCQCFRFVDCISVYRTKMLWSR